jgi:hypothetical protein
MEGRNLAQNNFCLDVCVDPVTLHEFEEMVKKDFVGQGLYPTSSYILPSFSM